VQDNTPIDRELTDAMLYGISVSDGQFTITENIIVTLDGLNDNDPEFVDVGPFAVLENSEVGTVVDSVIATDPDLDPVQTLTYTEVSGGAGETVFEIDPATGEITVEDQAALDSEVSPTIDYEVTVSDGEREVSTTLTISIVGVNDSAPEFTVTGPFDVDELAPVGTPVGTVEATDADGGTLTFGEVVEGWTLIDAVAAPGARHHQDRHLSAKACQ